MALLETQVPAVTLSETAAQQIRELMESNGKTDSALRIFVQGGGCSGSTMVWLSTTKLKRAIWSIVSSV